MTALGNMLITLGIWVENFWGYLKNYARKCRIVYAHVYFT